LDHVVFHGEVNFSRLPFVAELSQERGHQSQKRGFVGKQGRDAGAAFEFLVDPFDGVAGAQPFVMRCGQAEHGKTFRQVFLHPRGELGCGGRVAGNNLLEPLFGCGARRTGEDGANSFGHLDALIQLGHVSLRVLLQMELAALP